MAQSKAMSQLVTSEKLTDEDHTLELQATEPNETDQILWVLMMH